MQRLSVAFELQGFGPDLRHVPVGQIPGLGDAVAGNIYRPHAPVACWIGEEAVLGVGGSEKDALPRVARDSALVCPTVDVILAGDERAQGLSFCFLHPCELAELVDPEALELLGGRLIPRVSERQRIVEPVLTQARDQCRFADTLRACQYQHGVELDSRPLGSAHSRAEQLTGDSARVFVVLCTEIID